MSTPAGRIDRTDRTAKRGRRGFWPMRDLPVVFWLLATVVAALLHPVIPAPRWLLIHLTLLGAVTHSIFVWSRYFTDTLLHTPTPSRSSQNNRLALLDLAVLAVVVGVMAAWWPVTLVGAVGVLVAVMWHGLSLLGSLRSALAARFGVVVRFYLGAALLFPVGIVIGAVLARVQADPWHGRLLVAHATVNLLGWIGLTVVGTLVTLWPTMLRTRMAAGIEKAAARALPVLATGIAVATTGALIGTPWVGALGLAGYLVGILLLAPGFIEVARRRPVASFSAASALAAANWLVGSLLFLVVAVATADSWAIATERFTWFTPFIAAGFGAQILLGALSYLIPVVMGGGPAAVAAATRTLDRAGLFRVTVLNASLLVCVLPVPPGVRTLCSALALVVLASFLPLLLLAIRASLMARRAPIAARPPTDGRTGRRPPSASGATPAATSGATPAAAPAPRRTALATGLVAVLAVTLGGVVLDGGVLDGTPPVAAGVVPTGHTTVVEVSAKEMQFTPSTLEVPVGDRLLIELTNTDDSEVHDLVLDDGTDSGRLSPGDSTRVEVPVVGRDVQAWCSVIGHQQMGMTLSIIAVGAETTDTAAGGRTGDVGAVDDRAVDDRAVDDGAVDDGAVDDGAEPGNAHHMPGSDPSSTSAVVDPHAQPPADFTAHDAVLPPLEKGTVHRHTFRVSDTEAEVAPGVTQTLWTYNGTAPGPTLHGQVGDRFVITLVNDGSIGHSIDFHAGALAPDRPMRTLPPGKRLTYRFTATKAGIWMYHCSSMPMSAHIANGLFGAVVIEPPDLAPVDTSFLLIQSEFYLGPQKGSVDVDKIVAERPDLVVFNGYANQYDHRPLRVKVGERVRIWVLDAGPNRGSAFHVVGGQFDTTYLEGSYLLRPGTGGGGQTLGMTAAQGGFVEMEFPEAGNYPFISHVMVDGERGAHGMVQVTQP